MTTKDFIERYGPTITAFKFAASNGKDAELKQAMYDFCDEWNRGHEDDAYFEQEYLLVVGTKR